jgi:hypothetical protein
MGRFSSHRATGGRSISLQIVGLMFTALGIVLLIGGFLLLAFGLNAMFAGPAGSSPGAALPGAADVRALGRFPSFLELPLSIYWSVALLVSGLQYLALGALCRLFVHLEENTRVSAQCLERLIARLEPVEQDAVTMFRS